jgi:hypothetical protein
MFVVTEEPGDAPCMTCLLYPGSSVVKTLCYSCRCLGWALASIATACQSPPFKSDSMALIYAQSIFTAQFSGGAFGHYNAPFMPVFEKPLLQNRQGD